MGKETNMGRKIKIFTDFFTGLNIYYKVCIAFLFLVTIYYLFQWPIFAGDTDLWYHLNGGRYILENKSVPEDSYFSFISPPREWVDYFWFFQVVVYTIHNFFDYYGLVFLRAILFLSITITIWFFLVKDSKDTSSLFYSGIILALYVMLLLPRYHLIRPHTFTYLFIVLFLYILEYRPDRTYLIPILSLFWVNLHGITYPVMILILLAYLLEIFIRQIRNKTSLKRKELYFIIPIIVAMACVYLTPHGAKLTWIPFVPTEFASLYIRELQPIELKELFTFNIYKLIPTHGTIFNILFYSASIAVIGMFVRWRIRLSHLILFTGGVILLTKGIRLKYECALLILPVLKDAISLISFRHAVRKGLIPRVIFIVIVLLMPFMYMKGFFAQMPKFPFSFKGLPHGITLFLNKIDAKGFVLNHPNTGGYIQWKLYPKYKIFMDMEVPFLFTNEDFYVVKKVFTDELFLKKTLSRYDPSFITVPLKNLRFRDLISSFPDYRVVFFDDEEVLYINRNHYPSIASMYELKAIEPYAFINMPFEKLVEKENMQDMLKEAGRLQSIYPECGAINHYLSKVYMKKGMYEKALYHAKIIKENFPESITGYRLMADIYKTIKDYDKAIENYKKILKFWNVAEIHKEIGLIYFEKKEYDRAYKTLVKAMNIYEQGTDYKDLYYLILSALYSHRLKEAKTLFYYAFNSVPEKDIEWYRKYEELQGKMQNPENRRQK
ncbi:MAG TPA: hypothetical protein DDW17_01140 [Deltaproteobacteria bacterium]|nr:hypothetical protein [Deltaproteobacteria bacterium]